MKTEMKMAYEGEFLREYGKQYFIVASEALNIGRVKWNMVPIGKGGQKDIAFYMTTEQMLALCSEILDGTFAKKLAEDASNAYPSAYRYATGEDGALHLNIGGGKVGCRVQMQDAKSNTRYLMAVSMESLATMARKYLLATGLTSVVPGSYYASVVTEFEKGRVERSKFRKTNEDVGDPIDMNNDMIGAYEEEPVTPAKEENKETTKKVEPKKEPPKAKEEPHGATEKTGEVKNFTLLVNGKSALKKGFVTFEGKDESGNKINLMFRKEDTDKLSWFESFSNAAMAKETSITICGERKGDFILYVGPAKK
jgi:hypothetical protein